MPFLQKFLRFWKEIRQIIEIVKAFNYIVLEDIVVVHVKKII